MNLFEEIFKKYPKRFLSNYIECCEGWASLIEKYLIDLEAFDPKNKIKIDCIKEKYGHLTIITLHDLEDPNDKIFELGEKYRRLSSHICELCGDKGKLISVGTWLMVRCETCKNRKKSP